MGKGDKKTKRGKITIGTYGVRRRKKKKKLASVKPKTAAKPKSTVKKTAAKPKTKTKKETKG